MASAFITLATLKTEINITDSADDTILNQIVTETNSEADSELTPIVASVPITSPTQTQINFALSIGAMKWYYYIKSWSAYNKAKEERDRLLEDLKKVEVANATTRHQKTTASRDFRSRELDDRSYPI